MGKFSTFKIRFSLVLVLISCILFNGIEAANAVGLNGADTFSYPLKSHKVVRSFEEPITQYSSGHRGVDFYAPKGTPVFAVGDGQVIFAGLVAGGLHVTLAHGKELKSTYTFLASKKVKLGDTISKGDLIGTTSGGAPPAASNTFLFTMRFKNQYVDPMKYLKGEIRIREIRLGAISKENKSLLQKLADFESKQIKSLFDIGIKFGTGGQSFLEWLEEKGIESLQRGGKLIVDTYDEAKIVLEKLQDKAKQILKDAAAGFKDKVEKGIKELKKLENEAIEKLKRVISVAKMYGEMYLSMYKQALLKGIEVAKIFLEKTATFPILMAQLQTDLFLGIYDWSITAVNTTLKVLDQYFDVDWSMLLRELVIPVSCIAGGCTSPIKLACDPKAGFKVRTSSGGYKGSGNGVMFIPGLNSSGSTKVLVQDKGDGTKVGQSVNFPWKTLGYSRDDVSFYSYNGVGKDTDSDAPFQDLHISAAQMDKQIRQWKKDNPGKKLDLIGHSLGGSVTALWLAEFYDDTNPGYPKLGKVIMYAPPLTGTAAATSGQIIDSNKDGAALHDELNSTFGNQLVPTRDSESLKQVAENGELEKVLRSSKNFKKIDVQVIRSASDWVVPAGSQPIDGVAEVIIDTDPAHKNKLVNFISPAVASGVASFTAHSDITTDEAATSVAQRMLEGKKAPCVPAGNSVSSIFKSATVHATEVTLARGTRDFSSYLEYSDFKKDDEEMSSYLNSFAR